MPSPCSSLDGVVSIADDLLSFLASRQVGNPTQATSNIGITPPLHLPDVNSQSLQKALSRRPLAPQSADAVLQIFVSRKVLTQECYHSNWENFFASNGTLQHDTFQLLEKAFKKNYLNHVKELEQGVLAVIDERIDRFCRDAEASAQSETESSSEDAVGLARGHSRLAVVILEKAYERTTNISRAEKIRLAAATKLEPRQVTIWFQNRRNRKAVASKPSIESSSPTVAPSTPSKGLRKRKAEGLYEGEIRQPCQRLRTTTPDNPSIRHVHLTSTSSTSSMNSSIDSLASFSRGTAGKDRNHSTESSEIETMDTCYSKMGFGATSFDDQLVPQPVRAASRQVKVEEEDDPYNALIFSDAGQAQLDLEDLHLDLASLEGDLPSFGVGNYDFDFGMPAPSALISNQPASANSVNSTPKRPTFVVPSVPTTPYDAATALYDFNVDAAEELRRAQLIEEWAFGSASTLLEEEDDALYLNLDGLRSRAKNSPSSDYMSTSECSNSNVATPQDLFDFSFEGLCLDRIIIDHHESYQDAHFVENAPKRPQDLSIDVNTANACSYDDAVLTARDTRQECLAR